MSAVKYEPKCIGEALLPMKTNCSLLGLGIFEYPNGIRWTKVSIIHALGCLIWFGCMIYYLKPYYENFLDEKATAFTAAVGKLIIFVRFADHLSVPIFAWSRQNRLKDLANRISQSDARLLILKVRPSYRKIFFYQIGILVVETLHNVVITYITFLGIWNGVPSWFIKINGFFFLILPSLISMSFDNYFVVLVNLLGQRFSQLNDLLRSMMSKGPDIPQHKKVLEYTDRIRNNGVHDIADNCHGNDDYILMNRIRSVHLELVRLGQGTNSIFGSRILLSMMMTFCMLTMLLYRMWIIFAVMDLSTLDEWEEQKFVSSWLTFFLFKLLLINIVCGKTSNLAKETGDIICQLHQPSANVRFREEITDFVLQIVQNQLVFSPCGLIDLNNARIAAMIGSITTLLVIVIQIGDSPNVEMIANGTATSRN